MCCYLPTGPLARSGPEIAYGAACSVVKCGTETAYGAARFHREPRAGTLCSYAPARPYPCCASGTELGYGPTELERTELVYGPMGCATSVMAQFDSLVVDWNGQVAPLCAYAMLCDV
eukprot:3940769-Rhodomonas_salina.2